MPRKFLNHALDINEDFVRPTSLTLTPEELQNIPPPLKRQSEPSFEELIKMNLKNTGILRGWTRIRKAFGGEELGKNVVKKDEEPESKSRTLKPAFTVFRNQTFKHPYSKESQISDEHGFSTQVSMDTVPSPSMHASLSTPEYTNSEVDSSGDAFSDIPSPVRTPAVGPKEKTSLSPCQLKRIVIQPQIFELSDDDEDEDENDGDGEDAGILQDKIEKVRLPSIED